MHLVLSSRTIHRESKKGRHISQGSVATHLTWDGISINNFIARFLLNVSVKELWKSVNI